MAAMLTAVLSAQGYRVGRYTQPHLYSYRERVWALGRYVSEREVVDELAYLDAGVETVRRAERDLGPVTTFDVGTAHAMLHFARSGVEVAVLEVGVGGANDATNVVEPKLGLIGPVGLDHQGVLGETVQEIAREKAGIGRRGLDVVIGRQIPDALAVLRSVLDQVGSRGWELGGDYGWSGSGSGLPFDVVSRIGPVPALDLSLWGRHQRDNAAAAVVAAQLFARNDGRDLTAEAARKGLAEVEFPGRFQVVAHDPLTIVDGAHNSASAVSLVETLAECYPGRPVQFVLGMSLEKDAAAFFSHLMPIAERAILTRSRHARSTDPAALHRLAQDWGAPCQVEPEPGAALEAAWRVQQPHGVTVVTGSLFLVGDVLELLLGTAQGPR
jgi:dihydrofolate synthase/folylpolyglutamate synthase